MSTLRLLPALLIVLLLSGCAHWSTVSERSPSFLDTSQNFRADLPVGWHRYNQQRRPLVLTRDGEPLQRILIARHRLRDFELAHTQKQVEDDMLPQQVAEVLLDDLRLNTQLSDLEVVENQPAEVSDLPAFLLTVSYREGDLPRHRTQIGLLADQRIYLLTYEAPSRHYYARDRGSFDALVESFELLRKPRS